MRCERRASWLPIVPDRTNSAASWFVSCAMWDSREIVVGSSLKTSSRRVVFWIARSIDGVGVVTTSLRKSKAAGPGPDQAFICSWWPGVGSSPEEPLRPLRSSVWRGGDMSEDVLPENPRNW